MAGITPVISGRGLSLSKRNYNLFNGGNDFQGIDISWLLSCNLVDTLQETDTYLTKREVWKVIDSRVLAGRGDV